MCQVLASISSQSCQISKEFLAIIQRSSLLPFSLSFPLRSSFLKCISNSPIRSPFSTTFLYCHPYSFFFFGCWYFCHFLCLIFLLCALSTFRRRRRHDTPTPRPPASRAPAVPLCLSVALFWFVLFRLVSSVPPTFFRLPICRCCCCCCCCFEFWFFATLGGYHKLVRRAAFPMWKIEMCFLVMRWKLPRPHTKWSLRKGGQQDRQAEVAFS